MTACCRHLVDDHTPAGCVWCACRVTREEHDDRGEVDGLEDWRRAGGPLAEWTLSAAWITAPADAGRPAPVSGVIDRARAKPAPPASDRMRLAAVTLGRLGWDVRSVEIDLVAGRARIVLARDHDGRLVTLDADRGRVSVTREEMVVTHTTVGRRGDRCPVERMGYRLLGRDRFPGGIRSGLRFLANYLDDNSSRVALASARGAFRALLADASAAEVAP